MGRITIVGVGWTAGQLTLDAIDALTSGARVILHTDRCGCAEWLAGKGIAFESLDALYERFDDFDEHAEAAAEAVISAAETGDVTYAVFDVRDRSAARLCRRREDVRVIAGPPAEGALLSLATGEMRCVEASDWEDCHLTARENCFVREIDGRALASEIKLKLMEVYPEETEIWLMNGDAAPERMPLYALDRAERFDHRTCALVPAQRDIMALERYDFYHLMEIMRFLTGPEGCPWDRVQTHESLRPFILEEAYEVVDAIDEQDPDHLYDELGDMLLQIALHAEIARRHGEFDDTDVTTAICEKMIHRHSHVFGRDHADDAEEVLGLWSRNKMAERGQKTRTEAMRDITRALPATLRATKLFKRASEAGLHAADAKECLESAEERMARLRNAEDPQAEIGDAMMALCDYARASGVDPELALNGASARFIDRFEKVEQEVRTSGEDFDTLDHEKLRKYWELVKL